MYFLVECTGYREVGLTHTWTFFLSVYYRHFNCLITVKHVGRTIGDSSGNLRYRYEHIQMEQQQEVLALCLRSQLWLKAYSRRLETMVQTELSLWKQSNRKFQLLNQYFPLRKLFLFLICAFFSISVICITEIWIPINHSF